MPTAFDRLRGDQSDGESRRGARIPAVTPTAVALCGLLLAAIALRLWAVISYKPAVLTTDAHDAAAYIGAAHLGLSWTIVEPSGYPLFLRALHALSHSLNFTIIVQHLLGLATGILLFLSVRALRLPAWLGLIPAAVVWFDGDQLFLEHAPLTEALFTFLVAAMLYASIRSLRGGAAWSLLAGALAASTLAIRAVGAVLPVVVIVWLVFARLRSRIPWRRAVLVATAAAALVIVGYGAVRDSGTGHWSILPAGSGWSLYARTAPFADCRQFRAPSAATVLCQRAPPAARESPSYYLWVGGPARTAFGGTPSRDGTVKAFATAAILHQPLDYLDAIWNDARSYITPGAWPNWALDHGATSVDTLDFPWHHQAVDPAVRRQVVSYYGPLSPPNLAGAHDLLDYQRVFRVTGTILVALLVLGVAALVLATGLVRYGAVLFMAVSLALLLVPDLVLVTEWRYAVPALGPVAAAAAIGAWTVGLRLAQSRPRSWRSRLVRRPSAPRDDEAAALDSGRQSDPAR